MNPIVRFLFLCLSAVSVVCAQQTNSNSVAPEKVMLPMRDGVKLATDIFLPVKRTPLPVVLVRTPYNKDALAGAALGAAKLGYAVVVQDTRGRFSSEGENLPFNIDAQDGADTVSWILRQGWCNGRIGTFGGSALGITQLQLAGSGLKEIACQHITVAGPSLFDDVVYTGGVFRKALIEDWLRGSKFSPRALELWAGHSHYDKYWQERDVSRRYRNVNWPAVHIGGYFDIFAQATIDEFLGFQTKGGPKARGSQKLLMGPWTHGVLTDRAGDLVFPNAKRPPNGVQDQVRFWECYLKGVVNGFEALPAVTYYVMGDTSDPQAPGNVWRTAEQWPPLPSKGTRWYFHEDKTLSSDRPKASRSITYIYDPRNPVPTIGGCELTIPAGPKDQRPIEDRDDLVTFTSEPLAAPMEIIGQVRAKLYVSTDVPDTDLIVRVCDVYPDGRSFNICQGVLRTRFRRSFIEEDLLKKDKIYRLEIPCWSTSIVFNKGHRVRVHVTSSSAPAYDPNPNTGEPLRWSDRMNVAHTTIHISSAFASLVELPVVQTPAATAALPR